ncbi:hypothetical protein Phum_PHUM457120 [Pediculus humanus corporis]|uniref:Uncharacterized protein n=1 Tax=Pediculus humanus subsp. corporis TaxID=121224 RepID=E0VV00_PEDHC|nr:uncharacterized protein Phum_PHUM457120 [Pediculus humanus corporis]EEB17206.1 hypothetical protein Phum_PHUM457120 [Pediculus humanus corporis]
MNELFEWYESNFNQNLILPMNTYLLTPSPSDMNMMIPNNSCTNNVYLTLNPLSVEKSCLIDEEEYPSSIQSKMECFPNNEQTTDTNKEYKNYNMETFCDTDKIETINYEQKKKVGFTNGQTNENNIIQKTKTENLEMIISEPKDVENVTLQRKNSKKNVTKSFESRKLVRAESVKKPNENQISKENLTLRKSKSDAVMSTKKQNGDTPSVKIQFTKEGIKLPK